MRLLGLLLLRELLLLAQAVGKNVQAVGEVHIDDRDIARLAAQIHRREIPHAAYTAAHAKVTYEISLPTPRRKVTMAAVP